MNTRLTRTSLQPRRVADFSQLDQGHTQRDTRHLKTSTQAHPTTHNLLLLWLKQPYKHQVCDSPPGPPSSTPLPSAVDVSPSLWALKIAHVSLDHPTWQAPFARPHQEAPASRQAERVEIFHTGAHLPLASDARASWQHPQIKQGVWVSLSGDKGGPSGKPKENTQLALNASYCHFICQWKGNLSGH